MTYNKCASMDYEYGRQLTSKIRKKYHRLLSKGEEIQVVTGYSRLHLREVLIISFLFPGGIFILFGVGLALVEKFNLIIGIVLGTLPAIGVATIVERVTNQSHHFVLTNRRVVLREGFLNIRISSVFYDKVTHITVDQGILDRIILGHGTVIIDTSGSSGDELILKYVAQPIKFKNVLENLIHEHHITPATAKLLKEKAKTPRLFTFFTKFVNQDDGR
jgi:uncharacterized membrane protein YdbT with pleckstrin-like domain